MRRLKRPLLALLLLCALGAVAIAPAGEAQSKAARPTSAGKAEKAAGLKTAPIVMEVWSDFQCPACRTLFLTTLKQVKMDYVAAGKVYLVHRDMPLPMHQYSREAARYVNAAARLGKFELVAEAVYEKQELWAANGDVNGVVASVLTPAEMKRVTALAKSAEIEQAIEADIAAGRNVPVQSTPTSVIRARGAASTVPGAIPYTLLKRYFDDLLR